MAELIQKIAGMRPSACNLCPARQTVGLDEYCNTDKLISVNLEVKKVRPTNCPKGKGLETALSGNLINELLDTRPRWQRRSR